MSVLANIRAKLVELLEGTAAGGIRMPAAGAFAIVGDDALVQQADAADDSPRPVYIGAGTSVYDATLPSDVSGNYHWEARTIPIFVLYAYSPDHTKIQRDSLMDDDERAIKRVLSEPLNLALVTDWAKAYVETTREEQRDAQDVAALKILRADVTIAYREDWST